VTPHDEEQQRQRRLDALSQLAATAPGLPPVHSAPPLTNPTAPRRPRWLFPLVVLLIVALLAGAGYVTLSFFHPGSGSAPPIPTSLTIDLDATVQLDCPQSVLWAPDGTRVAVFGSQCAGDAQVPTPYFAVFDARTGKKVKAFDLGTLLSAYGMIPFSQDVAWSRDSTYLVVDDALAAQGGASGTPGTPAALVLPLDGSHPHTLAGSPGVDGRQSGTSAPAQWPGSHRLSSRSRSATSGPRTAISARTHRSLALRLLAATPGVLPAPQTSHSGRQGKSRQSARPMPPLSNSRPSRYLQRLGRSGRPIGSSWRKASSTRESSEDRAIQIKSRARRQADPLHVPSQPCHSPMLPLPSSSMLCNRHRTRYRTRVPA
jgi:hypothetical protein